MKDKAYEASRDIIMKWNDLPEQNTIKYLDGKFDQIWKKQDVNEQGFIEVTEAFNFERQLMGTFSSLIEVDTENLQTNANDASNNVDLTELGL